MPSIPLPQLGAYDFARGNLLDSSAPPRNFASQQMTDQLSNPVRSKLKSLAQRLNPLLVLGKQGANEGFVRSLDETLALHELVKIRFGAFQDERKVLAPELAEKTRSHLVWIVGHVAVFYRQNPDAQKRKVQV